MYYGLTEADRNKVIAKVLEFYAGRARSGQKRHGAAFSCVQAGELLRIFYADEFPEMQHNAADRENKTACLPSNRVGNTTEREDTQ